MNPSRLGRWRKLYCSPSSSWLSLSHSTRGLGYELLRVCDDEGRIECGKLDPLDAVMRLCAIGPPHRRLAKSDFAALLADGFVRLEGTTLVVRNFSEAQGANSAEAAKKERQRAAAPSSYRRTTDVRPTFDTPPTDVRPTFDTPPTDVRPTYDRPSGLTPREDSTDTGTCPAHSEKRREEIETDSENRVVELHSTPPPEGEVAEAPASPSEPCATAQLDTPAVAPRCDAEPPEQPPATPAAERPVAPAAGAPAQPVLSLTTETPPPPTPVEQVFAHWRAVLDHPRAQLDAKRRRTIERALKSHGLAACLAAVNGCARSDFHMGRDPRFLGQRHDGIDVILRDAGQIEKFERLASSTPAGVAPRSRAPVVTRDELAADLKSGNPDAWLEAAS